MNEAKKLNETKKQETYARRFEYDYRKGENGKKCTREEFFYKNLNSAIAQEPSLVSQYPALSILYSKDGKAKSFEELISGDFLLNEDSKSKIPEDFCKYYISNGELDNLDLNKFPENVQANIASRLISILKSENIQIAMMGRNGKQYYQRPVAEKDKIGVESFHLKTSRNIMRFMNKNYQYFRELQDNGAFTSITEMDAYDDAVGIFVNDSTYENLAYNNSKNIETVKQLALEAVKSKNAYRNSRKQKEEFTPNALESAFGRLVSGSRLSIYEKTTRLIKSIFRRDELPKEPQGEEKDG